MSEPAKSPLNVGRVVLVFTLLPLVLGLDRWAYWGSRSMLLVELKSVLGVSTAQYGTFVTVQSVAGALTVLLGGAIAIATGPSVTLALGALLSIVAYAILAVASGVAGAWAGVIVLALGQGLFKPSAFALAAMELSHPRSHLRSAACVALYSVVNVSALVSPPSATALAARAGVRAAFVGFAVSSAVATFLALALAIGWFLLRPKPEQLAAPARSQSHPPTPTGILHGGKPPKTPDDSSLRSSRARSARPAVLSTGRVALGAVLISLAVGPYHTFAALQSSVASDLAYSSTSVAAASSMFTLNPLAVLITALLVLPVLVVLHVKQVRSGSLFAVGAGLCLTALAVVPMLLARQSFVAIGATELAVGAAEVLIGPFALSRVAGDLPPRFVTAAVALYQFVVTSAALLGSVAFRNFHQAALPMLGVLALVVFVVGVALLAAAAPLGRALYEPQPQG